MTLYLPNATAIEMANLVVDKHDAGSGVAAGRVDIFPGTAPADADAAQGNTRLVSIVLQNPSHGAAADQTPGARATLNGTPNGTATASGTATHYRSYDRDGNVVSQGDVGSEMTLVGGNVINTGADVTINTWNHDMPESGS